MPLNSRVEMEGGASSSAKVFQPRDRWFIILSVYLEKFEAQVLETGLRAPLDEANIVNLF